MASAPMRHDIPLTALPAKPAQSTVVVLIVEPAAKFGAYLLAVSR